MTESGATFGAVGDIALAGATARAMRRHGHGWAFERVLPQLRRADVLFGNLECAVVPSDRAGAGDGPGLATEYDGTAALADAGFDVLSLANNHILDAGTSGLAHTASLLEARGIAAVGVGSTQQEARALRVLEQGGLRWGFLCYGEDSNYTLSTCGACHAFYEPAAVLDDVARARSEVDVLVVSVHADLEFLETPSVPRRAAFREFARAGATLVLGHHPHVPQGVETVGSSLVAYSLGNFVFPAHSSDYVGLHLPETARSFVLLVRVSAEGVHEFERVPVLISPPPDERPRPVDGEEADLLTARFDALDRLVADDAVVAANWRAESLRRLSANVAALSRIEDADGLLHALGRLTLVAENRAWVDEVAQAVEEVWEEQRRHSDPAHRPSHATERRVPPSVRTRLARAARRAARRLSRP